MRLPASTTLWPAALIWLVIAGSMAWLDDQWSLGNLALLLVLGSTLASFWLTAAVSVGMSALAVALFNWFFVPPRFTLHVQLHQDLLLLLTLLVTSTLISVLTSRLRQHAQAQAENALQAQRLQQLSLQLQHATSVADQVNTACGLLQDWSGLPVTLWLDGAAPPPKHPLHRAWQASQQEQGAIGPGTGRYEDLGAIALPLRAGILRLGTLALGPVTDPAARMPLPLDRLQALSRLLADEVHRLQARLHVQEAQRHLQTQQLRNTLLAAISHDYRTPLATITGAASSLLGTGISSVEAGVQTILHETEHLHRMTSNTLQMARLDTLEAAPQTSWESVEELCGVALAAARRRHSERRIEADVPANLPLLHCDPVLVVQLLDNLVENALRYSPANQPVTLRAHAPAGVQLEVLDRGMGIPPEWRERVFEPFRRVLPEARDGVNGHGDSGFVQATRRGMGLGLALCRAIAQAHGARLWIEAREGGGTAVCLRFAPQAQPAPAPEATP